MAKFEVTVTSRAVEAAKRTDGLPILSFFLPSFPFPGIKKSRQSAISPRSSLTSSPLLGEEGFARGANVVWKESTMDWMEEGREEGLPCRRRRR